MSQARSTLEALLVNDPEHPAIREFVLAVEAQLDVANAMKKVQCDVTALCVINLEMKS